MFSSYATTKNGYFGNEEEFVGKCHHSINCTCQECIHIIFTISSFYDILIENVKEDNR